MKPESAPVDRGGRGGCLGIQEVTMKSTLGLFLGVAIGAACRWFEIPVPAPPKLIGALLVVSITVGYLLADRLTRSAADGREGAWHRSD